jgi:hypothetical protein
MPCVSTSCRAVKPSPLSSPSPSSTGRSPEENPQALEEFKKFVLRKGLPQDGIFVPKQKSERRALSTSLQSVPSVSLMSPHVFRVSLCPLCLSVFSYVPQSPYRDIRVLLWVLVTGSELWV